MFFREVAVGGLAGGQEEVFAEDCHFPSVPAAWSRVPTTSSSDVLPPHGTSRGAAVALRPLADRGGARTRPDSGPNAVPRRSVRRSGLSEARGAGRRCPGLRTACPPALIDTGPGGGGTAGTALLPPATAGQRDPRSAAAPALSPPGSARRCPLPRHGRRAGQGGGELADAERGGRQEGEAAGRQAPAAAR